MSEGRFQLVFSTVLLLGTVWYAVEMASYPANAGRVPLIVALVSGAALVVQIIGQVRALRVRTSASEPATAPVVAAALPDDDPLAGAEERVQKVDNALSGYDTLLRLDRVRRWRLFAIVAFSILFYVSALMVGFVLTTGVLITLFLLVARERIITALAAGVVSAAAVYVLVVVVIGLPALDGYLF
jgi:hypothetical protein